MVCNTGVRMCVSGAGIGVRDTLFPQTMQAIAFYKYIFPVEVKSETNTTSKSLKKCKELFSDQIKLRVRFSLDNLKLDGDVLNIPLFMADQTDRLIG